MVPENYSVADSPDVLRRIARLVSESKAMVVDTETSGTNAWRDRVLCASIWTKGEAFLIPFEHCSMKCVARSDFRSILGDAFNDPAIERMNHNVKFDGHFIREGLGIPVGDWYCDTLLQASVIDPSKETRRGLKDLAVRYDLSKETGNYKAQFGTSMWSHIDPLVAYYYACKDVELVSQLKVIQDGILSKKPKLSRLFWQLEQPVLNITFGMEARGLHVDQTYLDTVLRPTVYQEYAERIKEIAPLLAPYLEKGDTTTDALDSPQKMFAILFDRMNVPLIKEVTLKKDKEGKYTKRTMDKDAMTALKSQYPVIDLLSKYRNVSTVKKMFVDALPEKIVDGRIHPTINVVGTETGRESIRDPNLQQIPSRMGPLVRNLFVPEPGYIYISMDYSQQESRIMAHFSEDPMLCRIFNEDKDIYTQTAIDLFGPSTEKVHPKRALCKMLILGLSYGMGPHKFAKKAGISEDEARDLYDKYHKMYPGVRRYQKRAESFATEKGYIVTLLGRERPLVNLRSDNRARKAMDERAAGNTPIQGTGADQLKLAQLKTHRFILANGWPMYLVLPIHDEILFAANKEWAHSNKDCIAQVCDVMAGALPLRVPMKCSVKYETRWGTETDFEEFDIDEDDVA